MNAPNKVPLSEAVKSLVKRSKDHSGLNYADYMSFAKDIWIEMNIRGIKDSKRFILKVDKKTNSVTLPEEAILFSTVYIFREGKIVPLLTNPNLHEGIIDPSAKKKCDCGSDICANVNNYEDIESVVRAQMPDGTFMDFVHTIRKKVKPDGRYVNEFTEPVKKYTDGIHTDTVLETWEEEICDLDLSEDGCIEDSDSNRTKIYTACGFVDLKHECGCPAVPEECVEKLEFNINDKGNRIVFPSNHSYDYVIVRAYVDVKTKDILIPQVCKKNFMDRVYYAGIEYDRNVPEYQKQSALRAISRSETNMIMDLSRMTIADLYNTISPQRK